MLEQYRDAVESLSKEGVTAIRRDFNLPPRRRIFNTCESFGLCQADLVLSLLRHELIDDVEQMIGHPIEVCPPDPRLRPARKPDAAVTARVVSMAVSPKLIGARARRWASVRLGLTVENLLSRGVTRRDIRSWRRRGFLVLE